MSLFRFLGILGCFCILSCGKYKLEEEKDEPSTDKHSYTLSLHLTSKEGLEITYPLRVFLFNEQQECVLQENITNKSDDFSTSLPKGKYMVSILSGLEDNGYSLPSNISSDSFLHLPAHHYTTQAIQIGKANVYLTKNTTAEIRFSHTEAAICLSVSGIPHHANAVEASFSPLSSGLSFNGNYSKDHQSATITCKKEGNLWTAGPVYVLPDNSSPTSLAIKVQYPQGDKVYNYTYTSSLKAGYPYQFKGNLEEGMNLNGDFQIEGWQPGVDIEFELGNTEEGSGGEAGGGEGGETLPDSGEEDGELDTFIVSSLPQEDAIWGYFYLWKLEKISTDKAKAIIISPDQYYRLTHEAIGIIKEYEIDGISNWRVLSIEEAKAFKKQFADNMGDFNDFLESNGLSPFYYSEGRYLCNDCQSTFGITSSRFLAAGKKTKYYLRPVKTILLKVQKQ